MAPFVFFSWYCFLKTVDMEKILVVDDDVDLLLVLRHALKGRGYQVITLDEGSHVIDAIRESRPDLIILDINIGEWDGREICQEIKKTDAFRYIPIILFSAAVDYEDATADCAADAFIQKPLSTSYFLKKIEELIAA
jgi:CheY-like chemotaxis protein